MQMTAYIYSDRGGVILPPILSKMGTKLLKLYSLAKKFHLITTSGFYLFFNLNLMINIVLFPWQYLKFLIPKLEEKF